MNYKKFPNNGIIKKHRSKNDLINISKLKLNDINLTFLPTKKVNLLVDSMAKAVVLLAGFNPLIHYNIDLKAKIKDINFDLESSHNNLQKKSIPLSNEMVSKFINCKKICIKKSEYYVKLASNKNQNAKLERMLMLGFVNKKIVPFQLNFMKLKNNKNFVSLGVLLNGKIYISCERYDESDAHSNAFYGKQKRKIDPNNQVLFFSPAHFHYYDIRALTSLYSSLLKEGYQTEKILTSRILTKMEAFPCDKIKNESIKKFFLAKYNIIEGHENMFYDNMTIEDCFIIIKNNKFFYPIENLEKYSKQNIDYKLDDKQL